MSSVNKNAPPMLAHRYDFEGQAVRYGVWGQGRPLVLLHGTPFSAVVWRRIAPLLARGRQVYAYDLLGYGQSEQRDGQDVSLATQGRLFAALLRHWKLARPDVVAHDFGGATALRAALLEGCAYGSLTLIDAVALAPWGSPFARHAREHQAAFAGMPPYVHAAILKAYIQGAAHRPLADDVMALYTLPWTGSTGQAAFYRQAGQADQRYTNDIEHRYGEIDCPVMILWGEDDAWLPIERGRALAQRFRGADFRPVPQAGHLMQEDAPEAIVAHLSEFLAAVSPPAPQPGPASLQYGSNL
ncbi:alpha/beta fold hydrolase [Bordetella sp. BOR01]|uniref:alpha/beta fold hydrolase n=1 Tax=Bordetella sp. BOR01 TaxID=2854779 RepID=UPI001C4895F3|nr:alpha/beta hydrolase [Bordetella sp. BOR01]MBV7483964.1 alpha/beta hydrolase [Bordetella sp. BOR01]